MNFDRKREGRARMLVGLIALGIQYDGLSLEDTWAQLVKKEADDDAEMKTFLKITGFSREELQEHIGAVYADAAALLKEHAVDPLPTG